MLPTAGTEDATRMRRTTLVSAATALLILASASPGLAQQAEAAGGPLREAGGTADLFAMVVATPPATRPTRPVEAWEWQFYRDNRTLAGATADTIAFRVMIDCQAETRQPLAAEAFLDGARVSGRAMTVEPQPTTPGTVSHRTIRIACEPGFAADRATYPDHRAARASADRHFSGAR